MEERGSSVQPREAKQGPHGVPVDVPGKQTPLCPARRYASRGATATGRIQRCTNRIAMTTRIKIPNEK